MNTAISPGLLHTGTPSREILWNVSHPANTFFMYLTFAIALVIGAVGVWHHAEIWLKGGDDPDRVTDPLSRVKDMFTHGVKQKGTNRDSFAAIAHSLLYFGFIVLLFTTSMVAIDHDFGIKIYQGDFYLLTTLVSDIFGLGVIYGCFLMLHRRYIQRPDKLHSRLADSLILVAILLLCVQGFVLEGLRISATEDPWAAYSPVGWAFGQFFWFLSDDAKTGIHFGVWWFHTLTVFSLLAIFPYTKFFHILSSSLNLYFKGSKRPKGALKYPGDLESLIEAGEEFSIGVGTIEDYTWKQRMDLDACTSCGRCQEVCPAYNSGKILSPKWLILDTRNHMLSSHNDDRGDSRIPKPLAALDRTFNNMLLTTSGARKAEEAGFAAAGAYRGSNALVQTQPIQIGADRTARIAGEVMDQDVFWSCTTCRACVEVCPVGINHVEQIVENRRNMVLMEGEIPSEAQATLRALENRGNPYGPAEDRSNWTDGLDVPVLSDGDEVEVLYWIGCVSAFDPRKQKIARAMVQILHASGVKFGILGNVECCTGDPARRLGEENLFQLLAKQNIANLRKVSFKKLIANCPHCFNTIKNEYPQFGPIGDDDPEILHHSQFLQQLLAEDRIPLRDMKTSFTFHDPCYLGRYNDEYEAPRETLKKVKSLNIIEMEDTRERGKCCGAGGGHFWMDMKVGERVNVQRVDQAAATGASEIAAACPFCMQMLEDGIALTNREDSLGVRDIAEVIADQMMLEDPSPLDQVVAVSNNGTH